jgi:hypothetical protein
LEETLLIAVFIIAVKLLFARFAELVDYHSKKNSIMSRFILFIIAMVIYSKALNY